MTDYQRVTNQEVDAILTQYKQSAKGWELRMTHALKEARKDLRELAKLVQKGNPKDGIQAKVQEIEKIYGWVEEAPTTPVEEGIAAKMEQPKGNPWFFDKKGSQ